MTLSRELLEKMYQSKSLSEMASELGMSRSTLYARMKKAGIPLRSKSEAQKRHLKNNVHQRAGKSHSDETREKISDTRRRFWDSKSGKRQRKALGDLRKKEWGVASAKTKKERIRRLQEAPRPGPGELSKFGQSLFSFLQERENVKSGIALTAHHVSDIILPDHKIVIELVLPISVYGEEAQRRLEARYEKLCNELNAVGYRVVIIQDVSNSISIARSKRVYDQLISFFDTNEKKTIIVS